MLKKYFIYSKIRRVSYKRNWFVREVKHFLKIQLYCIFKDLNENWQLNNNHSFINENLRSKTLFQNRFKRSRCLRLKLIKARTKPLQQTVSKTKINIHWFKC